MAINSESVLLLLSLVTGLIGMPIINWLKAQLQVEDKAALALASLISLVLAFAVTIATGQLPVGGEVTLEAVVSAAGVVFATANIFYGAMKARK